ncbi:MAG: hypothetical protein C4576_09375 [Desulfobacteraceae bacterium]|nr:MAG: hypothetical protein C4576_09375 [Desulfobacteraceae bacterium]
MLKQWLWWQIEVSLEHLDDESITSLSDLTIFFWMASVLQGVQVSSETTIPHGVPLGEMPEPEMLLYGSA